jgi:hypothetical protein
VVIEVRQCRTIRRPTHHAPFTISQTVRNTVATAARASITFVSIWPSQCSTHNTPPAPASSITICPVVIAPPPGCSWCSSAGVRLGG